MTGREWDLDRQACSAAFNQCLELRAGEEEEVTPSWPIPVRVTSAVAAVHGYETVERISPKRKRRE